MLNKHVATSHPDVDDFDDTSPEEEDVDEQVKIFFASELPSGRNKLECFPLIILQWVENNPTNICIFIAYICKQRTPCLMVLR